MDPFVLFEKHKRDVTVDLIKSAENKWLRRKKCILKLFEETFCNFTVDGNKLKIQETLNHPMSDVIYHGCDCISVTFPVRLTGVVQIKKGNDQTNIDSKKEIGASLVITFSNPARVNVFLQPSEYAGRVTDVKDVLIYHSRNPDDLTKKQVLKFVRHFLIFQRVDSVIERASLLDRLRVQWLIFLDVRNRKRTNSLLFSFLNHWGAILVTIFATLVIAKNT